MVIDYFHVQHTLRHPDEANTPLVIDADAVLNLAFRRQGFEPIAWLHAQCIQGSGAMLKLAIGHSSQMGKTPHPLARSPIPPGPERSAPDLVDGQLDVFGSHFHTDSRTFQVARATHGRARFGHARDQVDRLVLRQLVVRVHGQGIA